MAYYHLYEMNHALMAPLRAATSLTRFALRNPANPWSYVGATRAAAAGLELFERMTRRYGKPEFGIEETSYAGETVRISEHVVWREPFCRLLHFQKKLPSGDPDRLPRLLIVAPMSGHYATLLRGTVEAMLPHADVFITDWADARMVPLGRGRFDLDTYVDYIRSMLTALGPKTHVMAVCQPSVPVLAAVSLMSEDGDPATPASMTLMGGPVDTRKNPTQVNLLAKDRGIEWFARHAVMRVPFPNPGFLRDVYPGFLQLSGFMSMNLDRHVIAHHDLFTHLVEGDGDSAEKHKDFYDEYLAVMDLTAEFYLQTVDTVFVRHMLPRGKYTHRGRAVQPKAISKTALLTIEGEHDDISGLGQTRAAHDLCSGLAKTKRSHYVQPGVGHYGVFNGSRFKKEIVPRIADFLVRHDGRRPKATKSRG